MIMRLMRSVLIAGLATAWVSGCSVRLAVTSSADAVAEAAPRAEARGSDLVEAARREQRDIEVGGTVSRPHWSLDEPALYVTRGDERLRVDLDTLETRVIEDDEEPERAGSGGDGPRGPRRPGRGRQRTREESPDGKWIAVFEDWNVHVEPNDDNPDGAFASITTDGHRKLRYGAASWVYGEELAQQTAMWWSPDSRFLVFYEFDERDVPDYFLLDGLEGRRTSVELEGYPKPGDPNPIASLMIWDAERDEVRSLLRTTAEDDVYIYQIRFTPAGDELLVNRTNRKQNELDVLALDLETGDMRVVVNERQDTWQDNRPFMRFLEDGERFIWESARSGFNQYELRGLDGTLIAELSDGSSDVAGLQGIDEARGVVYYRQYEPEAGGDPLTQHLWRASLDGSERKSLTVGPGRRSVVDSTDGSWFIVTTESITQPPTTTLVSSDGERRAVLAEADASSLADQGYSAPERLEFMADDGETTLFGWLFKPKDFDPSREYALVVDVYGGPESKGVTNRYRPTNSACGCGFLVAKFDNRGTSGRGKAFMGAVYKKLGIVDIADQVAGVKHLGKRDYVDADRVGIYGHSYGGYMAALAIVKYPDVFAAAVAGAPVTDWRHYDTIYTERYMQWPEINEEGYVDGSCVTHAPGLEGRLLLLHGMMDDNVHPTNTFELVHELQNEGIDFDMMLYPTRGHSLGAGAMKLRWDYLYEALGAR